MKRPNKGMEIVEEDDYSIIGDLIDYPSEERMFNTLDDVSNTTQYKKPKVNISDTSIFRSLDNLPDNIQDQSKLEEINQKKYFGSLNGKHKA